MTREQLIEAIANAEVDAIDFKDYCRSVFYEATETMTDWSLEELEAEAKFYGIIP